MNTSLAAEAQVPSGGTPSRSRRAVHFPQLDGVRGIAIILVMLLHMAAILRATGVGRLFAYGWIGVDLFFALSGFLITRILVRSKLHKNYWSGFYSRRILRIWPLYYAYLIVTLVILAIALHFRPSLPYPNPLIGTPGAVLTTIVMHLFLLQNLNPATIFCFSDFASVTWSLCIEEHFYLLWPFLIRKLSIAHLKLVLGALLVFSPIARLIAYYVVGSDPSKQIFYYQMMTHLTPFHLDGLAMGSMLALFWDEAVPRKYLRQFWILFGAGLLASAVLLVFGLNTPAFSLTFTALAILFAGLIGLTLCGRQLRFFTNPALRYTGTISYGLYLIHPMVYWIFQAHTLYARVGLGNHTYIAEILAALLAVAISFGIASLSWKYFESPILRLKNRMAPE